MAHHVIDSFKRCCISAKEHIFLRSLTMARTVPPKPVGKSAKKAVKSQKNVNVGDKKRKKPRKESYSVIFSKPQLISAKFRNNCWRKTVDNEIGLYNIFVKLS